jgi:hypothetical protein
MNRYPLAAHSQGARGGARITRGEITASTSTTGISCEKALRRNTCLPKESTRMILIETLELHLLSRFLLRSRFKWNVVLEERTRSIRIEAPELHYSCRFVLHLYNQMEDRNGGL